MRLLTIEAVSAWADANIKIAEQVAKMAIAAANNRVNNIKKKEESRAVVTGDPLALNSRGKLADCLSGDPEECEIYLVEGDSAGGTCKEGRDRNTQAIFPLRGKCVNVLDKTISDVLKNKEYADLLNVLGCGSGKDFDISKLRYHTIVPLCDSDVDGSHIVTLLLTFIWTHARELIIRGHVKIANPPLYRVQLSKDNGLYIQDKPAMNAFLVDSYSNVAKQKGIKFSRNGKFVRSSKTVIPLIEAYCDLLTKTADSIGIHPEILDVMITRHIVADPNEDLNGVLAGFLDRFCSDVINTEDGHLSFIYENPGSVNNNSYCVLLTGGDDNSSDEEVLDAIEMLIRYAETNELRSIKIHDEVEGEGNNLLEMYRTFVFLKETTEKKLTISRFKGLGEMNPDQLWETTLNPETRILTELTCDDFSDEGDTHKIFEKLMSKRTGRAEQRRQIMNDNYPNFDKASLDV